MPEAESIVTAEHAEQKILERIRPILTAQSEGEVADFLRRGKDGQPYRGERSNAELCPIAKFVADQVQWLPGSPHVEVEDQVRVYPPKSMWPEGWEEEYDGPFYLSFEYDGGASNFIRLFDEGAFPDLVGC